MSRQYTLRPARQEDCDELFPIARDFATSFVVEPDGFGELLAGLIRDEAAWLQVAEADGGLIGYLLGFDHLTFYANGRVSWVEEVTVLESWRREGVGAALMAAFEEWARERNSRLVALATRRAAPFYSALGYEESAIYFRHLL